MKITPIEIRQKEFEKAFRGYEKDEVDAFLVSLSQEWEKILDENKEIRRRLEATEKEVSKLREVENSLFKALKTAEDTGTNVIEQANKSAELHLREAQIKAEAIMSDTKHKAKAILEDAEQKSREVFDQLQDEIKQVEREYNYIENQRDNLLADVKSLVNDVMEKISRHTSKSNTQEVYQKFKELRNIGAEKKNQTFREEPVEPINQKNAEEIKPQSSETNNEKPGEGSFFDKL
ncbi:MAG: DivIVA domain-containing protein [Cytophagaceae bacterium]